MDDGGSLGVGVRAQHLGVGGYHVSMPLIPMQLARVLIRETDDTHIVELREIATEDHPDNEGRVFPIIIGIVEAAAIERRLLGHVPPRPQTHELMADLVEQLGFRLDRIVIADIQEHTFFARLVLSDGARTVEVDSRPSDALALGAAAGTPIFVEKAVLDEVCREDGEGF